MENFEQLKVVGKGSFGVVRQVKCLESGVIYALKTIPLQEKKLKLLENGQIMLNEVEIMKNLDHPNVIRMFGSFVDNDFGQPKSTSSMEQTKPIKIKKSNNEDLRENLLAAMANPQTTQGKISLSGRCLHIVMEYAENGDV